MASSRRRPKARLDRLLRSARYGLDHVAEAEDGEPEVVAHISAASIRARCLRAFRLYEARLIAGKVDPSREEDAESEDAKAGAILDAEAQIDAHRTAETIEAFCKAMRS